MMKKLVLTSIICLSACVSGTPDVLRNDRETAQLAVRVGAFEKAREIAVESLQAQPDNIEARFYLADIYSKMNKYDMQAQELEIIQGKISRTDANYPRVIIELMKNNLMRHQYQETLSLYKKNFAEGKTALAQSPTMHGKSVMYAAIAYCKLDKYETCISELKRARDYLPGDPALADNLKIAQYMAKGAKGDIDPSLLYAGYSNTESKEMYANLIMALIRSGQETRAFELLSMRYSREDSMTIINDLNGMKIAK